MIPQAQQTGGCLRACVASLLEIPQTLVPDLRGIDGDAQEERLNAWLWEHFESAYLEIPAKTLRRVPVPSGVLGIATYKVRPGLWHSVIGRVLAGGKIEIVHDPDSGTPGSGKVPVPITIGFILPGSKGLRLLCAQPPPSSP